MNAVNDALDFPLAAAFEKDLTEALNEAQDLNSVVLVMLDLDSFLSVNKDFGQKEGDRVLIETGRYIKNAVSGQAVVYRYSGDEFALIFKNDMEKEDVFLLMEKIRQEYSLKTPDNKPVSISVGVSAAPEDATRYADLVRKAEGALYRGKANGKNRVCLARDEKMITKTSHYTVEQLRSLTKLSKREGIGEAILLREALDMLLKKYDI